MSRRLPLAVGLALALAGTAAGQEPEWAGVPTGSETGFALGDRIMAVVGDRLLLESEWTEQSLLLAEQFDVRPGTPEFTAIATEAFEGMVRDLVIVSAAERDTAISIDEDAVLAEADREIAAIRERFPSEQAFLDQLRQSQWGSLAAYRADIQDRKRREMLGQAFLDVHRDEIQPAPVTDAEIEAFWEENRAAIGRRPESFRFEEIPVTVRPDEAARDSARAEAERVLAELATGREFDVVARQHSDDAGTAESGGDLGWFGHGRMVPSFEAAAFEAPIGEVVGPIESPFGYHLIQVMDQRADERRARHILVAFERTDEDRRRAKEEAEDLVAAIGAGADVDSLQAALMPGDSAAAEILELGRSQLPPEYEAALRDLAADQATLVETATGFSVVVSRGRSGGGEFAFEEIAPRIRQQLAQQRAEAEFVARLRDEVYVDVRIPPDRILAGR